MGILQKNMVCLFVCLFGNFLTCALAMSREASLLSWSQLRSTSDATAVLTGTATQPFLTGSALEQWLYGNCRTREAAYHWPTGNAAKMLQLPLHLGEKNTSRHTVLPSTRRTSFSPRPSSSLLIMTCLGVGLFIQKCPRMIYKHRLLKCMFCTHRFHSL